MHMCAPEVLEDVLVIATYHMTNLSLADSAIHILSIKFHRTSLEIILASGMQQI